MLRCFVRIAYLVVGAGLLTAAPGCADSLPEDGYTGERGQVQGRITLDGQALPAGCRVLFLSREGITSGVGVVEADGQYSLICRVRAGLPPGEYLIQFAPPDVPESERAADEARKRAFILEAIRTRSGPPKEYGPIPAKYMSTATSKLQFQVAPGMNAADFALVRKK